MSKRSQIPRFGGKSAAKPSSLTMEQFFRAQGKDPALIKFGRLVPDVESPMQLTIAEFKRASVGGRALDSADLLFAGLKQQHKRASTPVSPDSLEAFFAHMADIELTLVLLTRFRRAALLIRDHVPGGEALAPELKTFDEAVPDLKFMRDTEEHFDDYILGRGRHRPNRMAGRRYTSRPDAGPIIYRGDRGLDADVAMRAAGVLYEAIYQVTTKHRPPIDTGE